MSILEMSLAGGALALLAAALRALFQKRLPRLMFLALWGVALVRFLIPFSIPSPLSARAVLPRAPLSSGTVEPFAALTAARTNLAAAAGAPLSAGMPTPYAFPWPAAIWIAGMILCMGFFLLNHLSARKIYAQSLLCRELAVRTCVNRFGTRRKIAVRVSDQTITPLTYGLFRPVILLPKHMGEEGRDFVLAHELCHIRRMDVLWKGLFALCACVHWFNPAAWLMLTLAGRDMELSCDERVIRNRGRKARKAYALTLLRMEERRALINPLASGFSKSATEQRIREVLHMKRKSFWIALLSCVLVAACATVFATSEISVPKDERDLPASRNETADAKDRKRETSVREAADIARMLRDQDEKLNETDLTLTELLTAVLRDAFARGEYDDGRLASDGSASEVGFGQKDAEERAALIAEKLRNIPGEIPDILKWTVAIRDTLIAEGLSYEYITEHFLVNWCYFDIRAYAPQEGIKTEQTTGTAAETAAGSDSGYQITLSLEMPNPDEAMRRFIGEAVSGVSLAYSTQNDPAVTDQEAFHYATYWDAGRENGGRFDWGEYRADLWRAGAIPLQYNDDPEWAEVVSPTASEGAYTRDQALGMATDALKTHLGIAPELLTLRSVTVDSLEKRNASMYTFWFNFQIDGIMLAGNGGDEGIVPFARVWVTDEGVRRMEATPLSVTAMMPVAF